MILNLRQFEALPNTPEFQFGCVVDTNILFGAAYPSDRLNTWADKFFSLCKSRKIPIYTNINIRSEFIDLYRRVLVIESLLMIREQYKTELSEDLEKRLKALKQRVQENLKNNKTTQISERDIKEYRNTLLTLFPSISANGYDLWNVLCHDFLEPQLKTVWQDTETSLGINFAGSRAIESAKFFTKAPNWDDATKIMGQSAMGSADAMIVNFFICSRFQILITADEQVAKYTESTLHSRRVIIVPHEDELV